MLQEFILVNKDDLLLSPKARGFVGFGMVDDVAIDNRASSVVWWRGGDWVVLTDGQVGMAGAGGLVVRKYMGNSLAWHT